MPSFIDMLMVTLLVFINILIVRTLAKNNKLLAPYMFFYVTITIELVGPIFYYYILDGTAYRTFTSETLFIYYFVAFFTSIVILTQLNLKMKLNYKNFTFLKLKDGKNIKKIYIALVIAIVVYYLLRYINQFVLVKALFGNYEMRLRSDTTGLIPHWFSVSSIFYFIIPSFYFLYIWHIKSKFAQFVLLSLIGLLTLIDGNRGVFVYLMLFVFIYVYKLKINKYIVLGAGIALYSYYLFAAGTPNMLERLLFSALRRFFVTQGACFINRIQMVANGYDFTKTLNISDDVFVYMYGYGGGAAPTVFWGDVYVNYGLVITLTIIVLTNWILYRISNFVQKNYNNNLFVYWCYCSSVYLLCMSGLTLELLVRLLLAFLNCVIITATAKNGLIKADG